MGIDSGWNYRLYTGFYIYAMKAAAVDEAMNVYHPITEMDILSGDPYQAGLTPDNFLKYQAETYEHDIAYEVLDEANLILVDGSLIARLMDVGKRSSPSLKTEYMAYVKPLKGRDKLASSQSILTIRAYSVSLRRRVLHKSRNERDRLYSSPRGRER